MFTININVSLFYAGLLFKYHGNEITSPLKMIFKQ